ncbi:uncharacterized protein I303_105459 [Kwoniella dejecticola CBS 10117]|uniref:GAF domain-containing protein n=1 Tax=Kwoniella dejecticola CBS 10117 TaxID=1296121 RepID=A0A1A6A2G2_9TREE|nr:GAF domain-containing protein [Kwoniella dejecticola CBS 10117]OBR84243.1 GAF domain-containing protein [Kwoniella dejecticola CBS 10117]
MPHADSSYIPSTITTKAEFYDHVVSHLEALLEGERYWVTNLAQTSAILYHSYLASSLYGGESIHPTVNWCGFYLHPPSPSSSSSHPHSNPSSNRTSPLLLGPYQGRPACLSITPIQGKGVCADGFLSGQTLIVPDVESYPGHIACDGETKSEIVVPLRNSHNAVIGVLDLDSTLLNTFDEDDQRGLERVVRILKDGCDWS